MEVKPWPGGPEQDKGRAMLQQQDQQLNSTANAGTRHTDVSSYELVLDYMYGNVRTSEVFIAEFICSASSMPVMRYQSVECSVNSGTSLRAPEAQLQPLLTKLPVQMARQQAQYEAGMKQA